MAINSQVNRVEFAGNSSTTVFAFPYYFLLEADLVVISKNDTTGVETVKTLTTDYTVTGEGLEAGGSVTMLAAPATGTTLIIYRDPAITQSTDYVENQKQPASVLEENFDRLTMIAQRLSDRLDRTVSLSNGFDSTFDVTLPELLEPYQILRVNAAADGIEAVDESNLSFDSASPSTTKGDLIVHDGSTNIRVAVGADKSYLRADSAETSGVKWVAPVLTTKGDIATFSTVEARLGVGANGKVLKADSTQTTGLIWGNAGGGGGSLQWIEADLAPVASVSNNFQVYEFEDALAQYLYASIRVPSTYTAGDQIKLLLTFYSPGTSGTALIQTSTTLIRTGTDLISSTTNQRTSTNSAVTLSGPTVNIPQAVILDLTSSIGQVNAVSVAAGDILLVRLTRDTTTDTTTSSVFVPVYGAEVTFS